MVSSADEPPLSKSSRSWVNFEVPSHCDVSKCLDKDHARSADNNNNLSQNVYQAGANSERKVSNVLAGDKSHTQPENSLTVDQKGTGTRSAAIVTTDVESSESCLYLRFFRDCKLVLTSGRVNWLLPAVPAGIVLGVLGDFMHTDIPPTAIFVVNCAAIIPLASLLAFATEQVASRCGDALGGFLNITFGNAVELIIFVLTLLAGEIRIVQAASIGSILSNLLLILGMSFLVGGTRYQEQLYSAKIAQAQSTLLLLSVVTLLIPTAFHASVADTIQADALVLTLSRMISIVLLVTYILYLLFSFNTHKYFFASTPQHLIDEESGPGVFASAWNSSGSSDESSTSSSSGSDNSATSSKATRRIKKVFQRRRKGSSSTDNNEIELKPAKKEHTSVLRIPMDAGSRDVDNDADSEQLSTRRGRSRKSKRPKHDKARLVDPAIDESKVQRIGQNTTVSGDLKTKPIGQLQHDRGSVKTVFNSNSIVQQIKTLNPDVVTPAIRRASSMPDFTRHSSPFMVPSSSKAIPFIVDPRTEGIIETVEVEARLSLKSSIITLLMVTGLVGLCAEFLVGSLNYMVANSGMTEAFIGVIILPLVGNAAEHVSAVTFGAKNKMDLATQIAVGSSIQIALFVTPLMVVIGWGCHIAMTLYFSLFETASLLASALIVSYLLIDGRSNWLEGGLLMAVYVILAMAAFLLPNAGA